MTDIVLIPGSGTLNATLDQGAVQSAVSTLLSILDDGSVHISGVLRVGDAPQNGWATFADNLLIGDGTDDVGITTFPDDSGIAWWATRTSSDNDNIAIFHDVNSDRIGFRIGGGTRYNFYSDRFEPASNGSADIGSTSIRFDDGYFAGTVNTVDLDATGTGSISGLIYPTADGSSGSSIVTDGAGNLSLSTEPAIFGSVNEQEVAFGDANGDITSTSDLTYFTGSRNLRIGNTTDTSANMTLITDRTGVGYIYFADDDSSTVGQIRYDHSVNNIFFTAGGVTHMRMGNSSLRPNAVGGTDLGASTNWWGDLYVATGTIGETGSGDSELNIRSADDSWGSIKFFDGANSGQIRYWHDNDVMYFYVAGSPEVYLSAGALAPNTGGGLQLGSNTNRWDDTYLSSSLYVANAPTGIANANYDDVVIGDGTGAAGITIYSTSSLLGGIAFGDEDDLDAGVFFYSHSGNFFRWTVNGSNEMLLYNSDLRPDTNAGLSLGDVTRRWNNGLFEGSLYVAGAPITGSNSNYDDLVIGDGTGFSGMSILANDSDAAAIAFGDLSDTDAGILRYDHNSDRFEFVVGSSEELILDNNFLSPSVGGGLNLGNDTVRFQDAYFSGSLYVDGAPDSGWAAGADSLLVGDGTTAYGLSIYPGDSNSGFITIRNSEDNNVGILQYNNSNNIWTFTASGSSRFEVMNAAIRPVSSEAGTYSLGQDTRRFGSGYFASTVYVNNAPSSGWNTSADDLVIGPGTTNAGISIFATGSTGLVRIVARDDDDDAAGLLQYNHASDSWSFWTVGVNRVFLDNSQFSPSTDGAINLGSNGNRWDDAFLEGALYVADAPVGIAAGAADDLVIGTTSTDTTGITLFATSSSRSSIYFGDEDDTNSGQIRYVHNGDYYQFFNGGVGTLIVTDSRLYSTADDQMLLGTAGNRWSETYTYDLDASGTGSISGLTYPIADGVSGSAIVTDGAGTLSFSSEPGLFGSVGENEVAFGDANGDITSDPTLTYDASSQILNLGDGTQSALLLFSASLGSNAIIRTEGVDQYVVVGNSNGGTVRIGGDQGNSDIGSVNNSFRLITSRSNDHMIFQTDNTNHAQFRADDRSSIFYGDVTGSTHLLVGDNSQSTTIITMLADSAGTADINYEDDTATAGRIRYDHSTNNFFWLAGGVTHMRMGNSSLRPNAIGGTDLGASSNWWGNIYAATGTFGETGSGDSTVIIRSSPSNNGEIEFFDGSTAAFIRYSHGDDSMRFAVDGSQQRLALFSTVLRPVGDPLHLGSSNIPFDDGFFTGSVYVAGGGLESVNGSANDLVIGRSDTTGGKGLSIKTPDNERGYVMFGDASDNDAGQFRYYHGSGDPRFEWVVEGTQELNLNEFQLFPETNAGLSLGGNSNRWNEAFLANSLYVAGAPTGVANGAADDLIIGDVDDNTRGMTIFTTGSSTGYIMFGDDGASNAGQFRYNHSAASPRFEWVVETDIELGLNNNALYPAANGGLDLGQDSLRFDDGYFESSLYVAGAPTGVASSFSDDIVIGTTDGGSCGITFLTTSSIGNLGYLAWGDDTSNDIARFGVRPGSGGFEWWAASSQIMVLGGGILRPSTYGGLDIGNSSSRWGDGYFSEQLYVAAGPTTGSNSNFDDVVIGDGTGAVGISLLSPTNSLNGIAFGDTADTDAGLFAYNHAGNYFQWNVNGVHELTFYNSDLRPQSNHGLSIGAPTQRFLNGFFDKVYVAGGPTTGSNANYDDLVIGDGTESVGISMLSPTNSANAIAFGDTANTDAGILRYDHNQSRFEWVVEGNQELNLSISSFFPHTAGGLNNGTDQFGWNALYLDENVTTPSTPTNSVAVYSDTTLEYDLKAIFDTGNAINFAAPRTLHSAISMQDATNYLIDWTNGDSVYSTTDITNGNQYIPILATYNCVVRLFLKGSTATSADGYGNTTARLYMNRSTSVIESNTQNVNTDAIFSFDLTGTVINNGDLFYIGLEPSSTDGTAILTLEIIPV